MLSEFLGVNAAGAPEGALAHPSTRRAVTLDDPGKEREKISGRKRGRRSDIAVGHGNDRGSSDGGGNHTEGALRRRSASAVDAVDAVDAAPPKVAQVAWRSQQTQPFFFSLDSHVPTGPPNSCTGFAPLATATANAVLQSEPEGGADIDAVVGPGGRWECSGPKVALGVPGAGGPVSFVRVSSTVARESPAHGADDAVEVSQAVEERFGFHFQVQSKAVCKAGVAKRGDSVAAGSVDGIPAANLKNLTGAAASLYESFFKPSTDGHADGKEDNASQDKVQLVFDYCSEPSAPVADAGQAPVQAEAKAEAPTTHVRLQVDLNDGPAEALMDRCLHHAAINSGSSIRGLTGDALKRLPQGSMRRSLVDDITVLVLTFPLPPST